MYVKFYSRCNECKKPIDYYILGELYEIEYLMKWCTVSRDIFTTNSSFIKVVAGKAHRFCPSCFENLNNNKRSAFKKLQSRELGERVSFPKVSETMSEYEVDLWIRSMIHCYKNNIDLDY
jgi:hypothetical protein